MPLGLPLPSLAYPLVGMVGVALGCGVYSMYHHLRANPEVHVSKVHRADGTAELPVSLRRAAAYRAGDGHFTSWYSKLADMAGTHKNY